MTRQRKYNTKRWERIYVKLGTLPGLHYFVKRKDLPKLEVGSWVEIRNDDGVTRPEYMHPHGMMIDEIRIVAAGLMYVAQRF